MDLKMKNHLKSEVVNTTNIENKSAQERPPALDPANGSDADSAVDLNLSDLPPAPAPLVAPPPIDAPALGASAVTNPATDFVVLLDPNSVRVGAMPNRVIESFKTESFDELLLSIVMAGGNTQPILVRPARNEEAAGSEATYELVYGERRLRACMKAGIKVRAIVSTPLLGKTAQLDTLLENRCREDLSPYEFGRQVSHVLGAPNAMSLRQLSALIGCNQSLVSRARDLAELPAEVLAAFTKKNELRYGDAKTLKDAVKLAPDAILAEAGRIATKAEELSSKDVLACLLAAADKGVAPLNAATKTPIVCEGREIGDIMFDRRGQTQIALSVSLNDKQRQKLPRYLEAFFRPRSATKTSRKKSSSAAGIEAPVIVKTMAENEGGKP